MKYKIGVVGVGMVGEQVKKWFLSKKYQVTAYDKFKNIGTIQDLNFTDLIFLCLPSAYDKNFKDGVDTSLFESFAKYFKEPKIFVIKSTVPPGTTNSLEKAFPKHRFFHSPEFLTEATAWEDFSKPHLQLLGYVGEDKLLAGQLIKLLPSGEVNKVLSANSTETFKYVRNTFFATKVIFVNQIYDICQSLDIDYGEIKELMLKDPWIGGNHLDVLHKGYRGFGGKCLPKDLKTFIKSYKNKKLKPDLFIMVDKLNDRILKKQGLTKALQRYWLNNTNPRADDIPQR